MATVEGTNIPPPSPRRRGGLPITVSGYRGAIVIRKRQAPKGPRKSPLQQAWVNNFSCIARWSKYADPRARDRAEEQAPDTGWYWRDIIETALSGKLRLREGQKRITTPTASVDNTAAEALTANVTKTLTPNRVLWDNNYFWNPSANQTRLTVRTAGLYLVGLNVTYGVTTTGLRRISLVANGATTLASQDGGTTTAQFGERSLTTTYYFDAGEYVEATTVTTASGQTARIRNFWILAITPETII